MARARCPRSSVEAGQKCIKFKGARQSNILLTLREFVVDSGASMHMISKKDLSDAEMDTLTKSCSPTIVITANGEVQTHEEATVYVKELDIFLTMKVLENTPAVLSLGMLRDENGYSYEWINGQKPHLMKNGIRTPCNTENFVPIVVPGLSNSSSGSDSSTSKTPSTQQSHCSSPSSSSSSSPTVSEIQTQERGDRIESDISPVHVSTSVDDRSGRPDDNQANKNPKPNKKESKKEHSDSLCSEIPEWLQEFREILVDDEIPVHGESHASSSHEASLEPIFKRSEDLGKHSVYTHFPKDRNCEICKRTKITRAPCRRRNRGAVPRAENFGDLITADHKVLSDNCESRNNHRYAIVVQDLATQWIQAHPCKTKTSQETQRSLQKFLEPDRNPKAIYTDNSLEFGKACEDLSWNHCTSTPHRSETNGIAERAVRRVKEGTYAVLLQSGLDEKWWQIPWNVTLFCETSQISCLMGRLHTKDVLENPSKDQSFRLVQWLSITLSLRKTSQESSSLEKKSYLDCSSDTLCTRVEFGRVTYWLQTLRSWKRWTHRKSTQKDSMRKR